VSEREPEPQPEPEPQTETVSEREPEPQPEPEPEPVAEPELEPAAETHDEAAPEPASSVEPPPEAAETVVAIEPETVPEATWDQERYTANIEEPDWWTPEDVAEPSVSEEPSSAESVGDEAQPATVPEPEAPAVAEAPMEPATANEAVEPPAEDAIVDDPGTVAPPMVKLDPLATPSGPDLGEETMLWFGQRPQPAESPAWPSEDAAGEMEVASMGGRGSVGGDVVAGLPGAQELDEALAAFDTAGPQRAPAADTAKVARTEAPPQPPQRPTSRAETAQAPLQAGEPRSPASRAYRRLRRIFPG